MAQGMSRAVAKHFAQGMQRIAGEALTQADHVMAVVKAGGCTATRQPLPKRKA